ncbi:MAG TPA: folate-binding protein [Gammaproteobacteria bacterium]|nr:folate-binding protein [Gammaproteobacteria bacterium]
MNATWQAILPRDAAQSAAGGSLATEAQLALDRNVACPLTDTAVLEVTGDDAPDFLQGQLTNSVDRLSDADAPLAAWCTAKGRVIALFRVLGTATGYRLLVPAEIASETVKRLRMFVLRADVRIDDVSERFAVVGLSGTDTPSLLAEVAGTPPSTPDSASRAGDLTVIRLRSPAPRFLVVAPATQMEELWRFVTRGHNAISDNGWRLLAVRDGRPDIAAAVRDRFVPQMLNLEALEGLRYDKGCYPGQEVVARMHYLGRLKRRMYRIIGSGATAPPAPGSSVRDADGAEAGEIVVAAAGPAGRDEALAVLRIDAADAGARLQVEDTWFEVADLPYPTETE